MICRNEIKLLPNCLFSLFFAHSYIVTSIRVYLQGAFMFSYTLSFSCQFVSCQFGDVVVIWSNCVTYYDSVQLGEFKVRPKEKVCSLESTFSQFTQKSQEIILFSLKKTSREDQEKPQTAFL